MKKIYISTIVIATTILSLSLSYLGAEEGDSGLNATTGVDKGKIFQGRTLERIEDPVVFSGDKLKKFYGIKLSKLRLYSCKRHNLETIPFQIDEKDAKGEYVFTQGKKVNKDEDKGRLDGNDEIVFMVKDAGDKCHRDVWPKGYGQAAEIEITDPLNNEKAWVYMFSFSEPPPLSTMDYIRYLPKEEKFVTDVIIFGFTNKEYPAIADYMAFPPRDTRKRPIDLLDRFKVRLTATFLWGSLAISKNETDINSKIVAFIDGPIRVIQKVKFSLDLVWGVPSPSVLRISITYPNSGEFPDELTMPFDAGYFFTDVKLLASFDLNPEAGSVLFYNEYNPSGVTIDGKMSEDEKALNLTFADWTVVVTPDKDAVVGRADLGTLLKGIKATKRFLYLDDVTIMDEPEDIPGQYGTIGWVIEELTSIKKGDYSFDILIYFARDFEKGYEVNFFNILDHPVEIEVQ